MDKRIEILARELMFERGVGAVKDPGEFMRLNWEKMVPQAKNILHNLDEHQPPKDDAFTPEPPKCRIVCESCGDITETGHTSWMCRFVNWLDK